MEFDAPSPSHVVVGCWIPQNVLSKLASSLLKPTVKGSKFVLKGSDSQIYQQRRTEVTWIDHADHAAADGLPAARSTADPRARS